MNIRKFLGNSREKAGLNAFQQAAQYSRKETPSPAPKAPAPSNSGGRELTTNVTFQKTSCAVPHLLTTSEWERSVESWEEIKAALEQMLAEEVEFVVLTVGDASQGIRFIQSCLLPDEPDRVTVELNLEEPGNPRARLVERTVSAEECFSIFEEYFRTGGVPHREQYKPVEFFKP